MLIVCRFSTKLSRIPTADSRLVNRRLSTSKVTFFPQIQTILKNRFHAVINFVIFVENKDCIVVKLYNY